MDKEKCGLCSQWGMVKPQKADNLSLGTNSTEQEDRGLSKVIQALKDK